LSIEVINNYILFFYNLSGMRAGNHTRLYELKNQSLKEVNVYDNFQALLGQKMVKHFGKDCYLGPDFQIKSYGSRMDVIFSVYKADDAECCSSGFVKFSTVDFISIEPSTLMVGKNAGDGSVHSWKQY